jgi:hypothetical protein
LGVGERGQKTRSATRTRVADARAERLRIGEVGPGVRLRYSPCARSATACTAFARIAGYTGASRDKGSGRRTSRCWCWAAAPRTRRGSWPAAILTAWDRQCAFCGFDGQLGAATVGVEAAHVRWFTYGGPRRTRQRPGPVLAAPQAIRPRRPRPQQRPPDHRLRHLHQPNRHRPIHLRTPPTIAPTTPRHHPASTSTHRMAHTRVFKTPALIT